MKKVYAVKRIEIEAPCLFIYRVMNIIAKILGLKKIYKIRKTKNAITKYSQKIFYDPQKCKFKYTFINKLHSLLEIEKPYTETTLEKLNGKDLVILDDFFPDERGGWRYAEYDAYLKHFKNSVCITSGDALSYIDGLSEINKQNEFLKIIDKYPLAKNIIFQDGKKSFDYSNIKGVYCIFFNNVKNFDLLKDIKKPFGFTLYPGGGFELNNRNIDRKLKEIFSSKFFRYVIVTQQITYDYLVKKQLCSKDKIFYIFGSPLHNIILRQNNKKRQIKFGRDKQILDICFVGQKYSSLGQDKGYDIFIDVAKKLYKNFPNVRFHVVGSFDENVIDITEIRNVISFYGTQPAEFFLDFYLDKDIILSPNRPYCLKQGSFDGFPLGTCVEASASNVACFITDPLSLNQNRYVPKRDIEIISYDVDEIVQLFVFLYAKSE